MTVIFIKATKFRALLSLGEPLRRQRDNWRHDIIRDIIRARTLYVFWHAEGESIYILGLAIKKNVDNQIGGQSKLYDLWMSLKHPFQKCPRFPRAFWMPKGCHIKKSQQNVLVNAPAGAQCHVKRDDT